MRKFLIVLLMPVITWGLAGCGSKKKCDDLCENVGDTQCTGTVVEECRFADDGCLAWEAGVDCADTNETCDSSSGSATCVFGCSDECATDGETQCNGTIIENCTPGADGCLAWLADVDCATTGQTCDDTAEPAVCAGTCTDQCTDGETQCSAEIIETCEIQASGCTDWTAGTDCAASGEFCDDSAEPAVCSATCVDRCTETETQCNGEIIETCEVQASGCTDWTAGADCAATGETCDDSSEPAVCIAGCTDQCTDGETQCNGDIIETCVMDLNGCLAWMPGTDCNATGEACDDSAEPAVCVVTCTDLCTEGETQCVGTLIQDCSVQASGCTDWVDGTDCGETSEYCDDAAEPAVCSPTCTDQCQADGESWCAGDVVYDCVDTGGCLLILPGTDCAATGEVCDDSTGMGLCVTPCIDECVLEGQDQCNGDVIETCTMDLNGCLHWMPGTDCADTGETCDDTSGTAQCVLACTDLCTDGETQCVGTLIQDCTVQASGCTDWVDGTDCGATSEFCDDSAEPAVCSTACVDQCLNAGDSWCAGDVIQDCVDVGGCLQIAPGTDCALAGDVCDDSTGTATCVFACNNTCTTDGATQCNGDTIETCVMDLNGCLNWMPGANCTDTGEFCDDSLGAAECLPCTFSCPVDGLTRCEGNRVELCGPSFGSCLEWMPDVNCEDTGEICDDSTGSATCVACVDDAYEPNNDPANAPVLAAGLYQLMICNTSGTEDDWFSIDLLAGETLAVLVDFSHAQMDIDLRLEDSTGGSLDTSGSSSDHEEVFYTAAADETVYLRVFPWSASDLGAPYDLEILLNPDCIQDADCLTGEICQNLACVPGCRLDGDCLTGEICDNNICIPGCRDDSDCTTGEICESNTCTPGCRLDTDCQTGEVCDSNNQCIVPGCIDHADCATGELCLDYACVVTSCDAVDDPCPGFGLLCDVSQGYCVECLVDEDCGSSPFDVCLANLCQYSCIEDAYEPNDDLASAAPVSEGTLPLALCNDTGTEEDWFSFNARGGSMLAVTIDFIDAETDLDLRMVDATGGTIDSSSGTTDHEEVFYTPVADETVFIRVYPYPSSASGTNYTMTVLLDPACTLDSDCLTGEICLSLACVPGCRTDSDCAIDEICENNTCIAGCRFDSDCTTGEVCDSNNQCIVPGCLDNADCALGEACDAYTCVATTCDAVTDPCPGYGLVCELGAGYCVECAADGDCPTAAFTCVANLCVLNCTEDAYEPNSDSVDAAPIALPFNEAGLTLCGDQDEDWFTVDLVENGIYDIHLGFIDADGDVDLRLYEASDLTSSVATSNSASDDEHITYVVPTGAAGTHYIRVYLYSTGVYSQTYDMDMQETGIAECQDHSDCALGEVCESLVCVATACDAVTDPCPGYGQLCDLGAGFCVECLVDADCGASPFTVCVANYCQFSCADDTYEPNDDQATAAIVTAGAYPLSLCNDTGIEEDWFAYDLRAGEFLAVTIDHNATQSNLNLRLVDATGATLDSSSFGGDHEEVFYSATANEIVSIRVWPNTSSTPGTTYDMTVAVNPVCTQDVDCPLGEICEALTCIPGCRNDGDCQPGEVCSNDQCIIPECIIHADCNLGEACDDYTCIPTVCDAVSDPCPGYGLVCDLLGLGFCVECLFDTDCPSTDFACVTYECRLNCAEDAFEPNSDSATAVSLTLPVGEMGLTLCGNRDEDWFTVDLVEDTLYDLHIGFIDAEGDVDLYLYEGSDLTSSVASGTSISDDEDFSYLVPTGASGTYYIRVLLFTFDDYTQVYDLTVN